MGNPLVINGFTISQSEGIWRAVKNGRVWFSSEDKRAVIAFAKGTVV